MGADPGETAALLDAVRPRTAKPLIVKLTPNCASPAAVAAAAEEHGADAVSLINTLRGMAMHPRRPGRALARRRHRRRVRAGRARGRARAGARGARTRHDPHRRHGRRPERAPRADLLRAGADLVAVGTEIVPRPARRGTDRGRAVQREGSRKQRGRRGGFAGRAGAVHTPKKSCKARSYCQVASMRLHLNLRFRRIRALSLLPARARDVDSPPMPPATKTPTKPAVAAPERSLLQRMEALQRANEIRTRRASSSAI